MDSIYRDETGYVYEVEGILKKNNDDFEYINTIISDGDYFIIVSNRMKNFLREFNNVDFIFKVIEEVENDDSENKLLTTFGIAENYYYGRNDEIKDEELALKYYKIAINEGNYNGYFKVENIYFEKNKKLAFDYYLEGTAKGTANCYSRMVKIYYSKNETENYKKCGINIQKLCN